MSLEPREFGRGRRPSRNVFGGTLESCSSKPVTGFFRNGCCDTGTEDVGSHTVCAMMTDEFLAFSKARETTCLRRCRNTDFRDSKLETGGVSARRAGKKLLKPAPRRVSCCARRTRVHSNTARSPI